MNLHRFVMPLAVAVLVASPIALTPPAFATPVPQATAKAQGSMSADQVRSMLMRQGYTDVKELKMDDGQWKAKAKDSDGDWDTLHIDARSGHQIDDGHTAAMTADQVLAKLKAAGYSGFSTLKLDDDEWETTAVNSAHKTVELDISAKTGMVTKEKSKD